MYLYRRLARLNTSMLSCIQELRCLDIDVVQQKFIYMDKRITLGNIYLRTIEDNSENRAFIKLLFQEPDIRKYYVLRSDHSQSIDLFVTYLSQQNQDKSSLNFVIESGDYLPVGLLTAELQQDKERNIMWNVAYAIHSKYRRKGYAYEALIGLVEILKNYSISVISLDISESNIASSNLAEKCGFEILRTEMGGKVGFIDPENIDLGLRLKWVKSLIDNKSKRNYLNFQAVQAYRNKNYNLAIELFIQSLKEPMPQGSPYSDGQIFSNLGMAYSSIQQYFKAYECLSKAFNLGIRNDNVIRELRWLKDNIGLG